MAAADKSSNTPILLSQLPLLAAKTYSSDLRAYVSRRVGSAQDIDDILQTVFLSLLCVDGGVNGGVVEKPFGYLCKIANRELARFGALRDTEIERLVSLSEVDLDDLDSHTRGDQLMDEKLAIQQQLDGIFSQLSPLRAAALYLVEVEGLSYAEAANEMQISEHALKKNLDRARDQLRSPLSSVKEIY